MRNGNNVVHNRSKLESMVLRPFRPRQGTSVEQYFRSKEDRRPPAIYVNRLNEFRRRHIAAAAAHHSQPVRQARVSFQKLTSCIVKKNVVATFAVPACKNQF